MVIRVISVDLLIVFNGGKKLLTYTFKSVEVNAVRLFLHTRSSMGYFSKDKGG